jgi:hypothetical protein
MGFKDEAREAFANLVTRVEALERLAEQLRANGRYATVEGRERVAGTYDGVTGSSRASTTTKTTTNGLDYAAVAFGLSEIKRKVAQLAGGHDLATEYAGTVQYFADVFAKADPSFDADAFRSQAGV